MNVTHIIRRKDFLLDEYEIWDEESSVPLQEGDTLFRNDDGLVQRDQENEYGYRDFRTESFFGYAIAYEEGANQLAQLVAEEPYKYDCLVIPAIFLYRHCIELYIKDLLIDGKRVLGQMDTPIPTGHGISQLWDKLRSILSQMGIKSGPTDKEELEAVEACITEFDKIDHSSMSFRYPVDKGGTPLLKNHPLLASLRYVDLQHLAKNMKKISAFFLECNMLILTNKREKSHLRH